MKEVATPDHDPDLATEAVLGVDPAGEQPEAARIALEVEGVRMVIRIGR